MQPISHIDLHHALSALLPIQSTHTALHYVQGYDDELGTEERPNGALCACLRLIRFEVLPSGERLIYDMLEQYIIFLHARHRTHPHALGPYLEAWSRVVLCAFEDHIHSDTHDAPLIHTTMPYELVFPNVLDLKRPKTTEDYIQALRFKTRLGRFLS